MKPELNNEIAFVRELMEGKPEEAIREAEDNYRKYLALVKRIVERLEREHLAGISQPIEPVREPLTEDDYTMEFEDGKFIFNDLSKYKRRKKKSS